jgi:hypothetical protein
MKRIVRVAAGRAHAQVWRDWVHTPVPGTELAVVSPVALVPHLGLVYNLLSLNTVNAVGSRGRRSAEGRWR